MARASWRRTHRSMSWVQRGRPRAVEAIPPMKAWGRPVPPATRMASVSTARKVCSSTSGRVPRHSRSWGCCWSSMSRLFHPSRWAKRPCRRRVAAAAGPCHRCRVMETLELLIGLLAAVAVVVRLAGRTAIPEPVLLMLAGLAVALIPGLPQVELDPELILALFLPPLLYWAALHTDLQRAARQPSADRPAGRRAGAGHHGGGGGAGPLGARAAVGGGGGAGGDRVPARPGGRDGGRRPPGAAQADGDHPGGRGAAQRRHRPGPVPGGGGRRGVRHLLARPGRGRAGRLGGRGDGGRAGRRLGRQPRPAPGVRGPGREHRQAAAAVRGLAGRRAAARLGGAGRAGLRGADGTPLELDLLGGPAPGPPALGLAGVRPGGAVVRARRRAAADRGRGDRGALGGRPGPGRPRPQPGGDRGPAGLGVPGQLAAAAVGAGARARPVPGLGGRSR